MSTYNIGFYEEMVKIIFQLSSNMHFVYSEDTSLAERIGLVYTWLETPDDTFSHDTLDVLL